MDNGKKVTGLLTMACCCCSIACCWIDLLMGLSCTLVICAICPLEFITNNLKINIRMRDDERTDSDEIDHGISPTFTMSLNEAT